MRISINWRFLVASTAVLLLGFVGLHFLHRSQVREQAGAFLRQADAARDATPPDAGREITYLQRYLISRPDAIDELERVGRLLARTAKNGKELQEAFLVLEDVLLRDPTRDALRKYAVEVALDPRLQLTSEAKGHLTELMGKHPGDGEIESLFAFCLGLERKFQEAADQYKLAYEHKPDQLDAYDGRAFLLREKLSQSEEADEVIAVMVRKNPEDFRTYLFEAGYWRRAGKTDPAAAALAIARGKAPNELAVILQSADLALEVARKLRATRRPDDIKAADLKLAEARADLDRAIPIHPNSKAIHLLKARMEADARTPADAVAAVAVGLKSFPDDPDLLNALVDYQIQAKDARGAKETLDRLAKLGVPAERLAFPRAGLLMLQEEWVLAAEAFEKIRRDTGADAPLFRLASLRVADCYEEIGETDRRLDAYSRAIPDDATDPLWMLGLLGQARAYAAAGRIEEASKSYQKVVDNQDLGRLASRALIEVARLRMLLAAQGPEAGRDWADAEKAMERAVQNFPDDTEALLLQSDLHILRKRGADAAKIVNDLFARRPKEQLVWIAKAALLLREGSRSAAIALLEKGRIELEDTVELRLAQARMAADPRDPGAGKKIAATAEGADKYPKGPRRRLYRGLAELAAQVGDASVAGSFWDRVVQVEPNDLPAQLTRFDRFLRTDDEANLMATLQEIRRVDGEAGASARAAQAFYLIWDAQRKGRRGTDNPDLDRAMALLDGLERDRPNWSRIPLGKARIWDLRGNAGEALTSYRQAVQRGAYEPQILRRLVELLAAQGLFSEADDVLAKLPEGASGGQETQRLAAEISLESANFKRSLELAAKAVPADSQNPADWLWLGRLRWAAGDRAGSGEAFQRAVKLNPKAPEGWLALVDFLATSGKTPQSGIEDAKAKIEEAKQAVPADARTLLLAQCYERVGQADLAQEHYRKARAEHPLDPRVHLAEANFLARTQQWALAREACERLISSSGSSADDKERGRNMFALCFAADEDYTVSKRAVELLGMEAGGALTKLVPNETPAQRRVRALALSMQRDRPSKLAAIALLTGDSAALTPADKFLLAKLYAQVGDRAQVRTTMTELLLNAERNPLHAAFLTFFVAWLAEQRDYAGAAPWVAKLAKLEPDSLRTAELQVRVLAGKNDPAAAKAVLLKAADRPDAPLRTVARIAEKAGFLPEAERWLQQFVQANKAQRPEVVLALAEFYGRTGRLKDAMAVCDTAWERCPPLAVAQTSVAILAASKEPTAKDWVKPVAQKIENAVQAKRIALASVQPQMAFLKNLTGDYDGAIAIFRTQADQPVTTPRQKEARALALNNLAYLLAVHQHNHGDALALLKTARELVGDIPDLLDTQALVLLDRGRNEDLAEARPLLEGISASTPSAVAQFHLALLLRKQTHREEAQLAWREAKRLGLEASDVHPIERPAYYEMERELR